MENKISLPIKVVNKQKEDDTGDAWQAPETSKGMALLSRALVNVEQVLMKNEEALNAVKEQLTKLNNQRIGLLSQKNMLVELKLQLEKEEAV